MVRARPEGSFFLALVVCVGVTLAEASPPAQSLGYRVPLNQPGARPRPEGASVLVRLAPDAYRAPIRELVRAAGGRVRYEYRLLPDLINVRNLPEASIEALERMPGVLSVERDRDDVRLHLNQSTPLVGALKSQVEAASFGANGSGIRVCIVDTGIDSDHPMYADRIDAAAGFDFANNDSDPEDDFGHGAHVAGIAVGGDDDGSGTPNTIDYCVQGEPFQGVAWEATLIGVKVIDAFGFGVDSDLIAGIDHCATVANADVINLSLGLGLFGGTCDGNNVAAAANAAVDAGVVVVASSGNGAESNAMPSPACGSKVIAVGATYDASYPDCVIDEGTFSWCTDTDPICGTCTAGCTDQNPVAEEAACFSNSSDLLDVVAPGCWTFSADYAANPPGARELCGTSMAAPHVSGLAALLLSENPDQSPARIRDLIRQGAHESPVDTVAGFDRTYGHGFIDALASLALVGCSDDADCDDGDVCTIDSCVGGSCLNDPDPTCSTCGPVGGACTVNADCCTGKCRGRSGSKTCR